MQNAKKVRREKSLKGLDKKYKTFSFNLQSNYNKETMIMHMQKILPASFTKNLCSAWE